MVLSDAETVRIFGVEIENRSQDEAVRLLSRALEAPGSESQTVFIVNAHTLNLAAEDAKYRRALTAGHRVLGDGTGVRWAARMRGVRMRSNLVGTDLVPRLMERTADRGYRCYLLGGDAETVERAAEAASKHFQGWGIAGLHHGYIRGEEERVVEAINAVGPDLLLVGMGNPLQEHFLARHRHALRVPLCIGVGGLFHHWSGDLGRAPRWVRRLGFEWLQILAQQPHKWRRYLLGNPAFLWRAVAQRPRDLSRGGA